MLTTMQTEAGEMQANTLYLVHYYCDTPGPEIDEDTIEAVWKGEVDHWGKMTFTCYDSDETYYLFPHEIIGAEEL